MLLWDNILKSSFTQTIPIVFDGASFGLKNNITLVSGTNLTENIAGRYIPNTSATPLVGNYKIHFWDNKLTFMIRNSDFTGINF